MSTNLKKKNTLPSLPADSFTSKFNEYAKEKAAEYDAKIASGIAPEDIAPIGGGLVKRNERDTWFKGGGSQADGFQWYDVFFGGLATVGDAAEGFVSGVGNLAEGVVDLGFYGVAGVSDLFGGDDIAEGIKETAQKDHFNMFIDELWKLGGEENRETMKDYSFIGDKSYGIASGLGQIAGIGATAGIGTSAGLGTKAASFLGNLVMGASSAGSGMSEAYQAGATDEEAVKYGVAKGAIDVGTEMIFGGMGKGFKVFGMNKGLFSIDDIAAKKISSKISNYFFKNAVELGVKATAEGIEELLAGFGTAAAKNLTYMSDEEFEQILADEKLLDQFVAGVVTSGLAQSGDYISSVKNKTDFVSGLTKNEEIVVEKEVEKRIEEAEKGGTTLSKKDKNNIYEDVLKDLDKGYISIDTIEEALGGDTYKSYKDAVDSENAIFKEYEELGKKTNPTLSEQTRYAELTEQTKGIKENSESARFKTQLGEEVFGIAKDSRLAESYNERARKGQYFEADLTQYSEKERAVVQKAIDSKMLNNTNRTHELVNMIAKISAKKNLSFDFTNNENLKKSGFAVDGKLVNGYVTKDGVTLNIDSRKALNSVVGHEITHVLEGTELYAEMQNALFSYAKTKNDYNSRRKYLEELYKTIEGADIDAELTADLVGDYLFTDEKFINHLSVNNRNVFQRVYDEIKYLCKIATAGSKEAKEFERVKRSFEKAYKQSGKTSGKTSGNTKYSLDKSVANENPTGDPDIRYSLSVDSEGRKLSEEQESYFKDSKVVDDNGKLKAVYHGSPADFNTFSLKYLGTNGTNEGYGFYFTDSKRIAEGYSKGHEGQQNEAHKGKLFEVYLDIKKPLSDTEITMSRSDFRNLLIELNNQVDEDGEPLEFLSNYGDVEWEGLNKVLNYAMEIEYDGSSDDVSMVHSVINACGDKELVFDVLRKTTGYDGIIVKEAQWGGDQTIYIAFHPEQIKNVDNLNPTSNPDIRYSLSKNGEKRKQHGKYNVYGEDIRFNGQQDLSAPVKEDIEPVKETVSEKKTTAGTVPKTEQVETLSPVKNEYSALVQKRDALKNKMLEFAKTAEDTEENHRIIDQMGAELNSLHEQISNIEEETNARQTESLYSLDDEDAPPETEAPYYGEEESYTPDNPFENRDYKEVGNKKVKAYQYENPEVKPFFQEEAKMLLGELNRTTRGERYYTPTEYSTEYGAESYGHWTGVKRLTSPDIAELLDNGRGNGTGYTYDEIEKGLKAIIEDNGKENNACSKRIEFIINDRLMNGYADDILGTPIPPNQDYINLLKEKEITAYNDEARKQFFDVADEYAPPEDISPIAENKAAPVKEQYEAIRPKKETQPKLIRVKNGDVAPSATYETQNKKQLAGQRTLFPEGKTAEILDTEPEVAKKKSRGWSKFVTNFLDKQSVFEKLALKTKNRELMGKANHMLSSESRAQWLIGKGTKNVKSLNAIREEVESTGKTKDFYEYLYHKHNIDRMSLEEKYEGVKNKAVFGYDVTPEVSQEVVNRYESENPKFKDYANDVYTYMNHLRKLLVDNGVISQETADLWSEMYPHYVPIRRVGESGLNINVPLDTGKTGVNAPIKRATGGNSDILPLFDTMALRTEQTFKAIAKNSFGVELKNALGTTIEKAETNLDEVIDSVDKHEELLKKGENGKNPTFTVFENGERVTFEITEDMYDALKPTSDGLRYTNKAANVISNLHRGVLTEYNPVFTLTNAIKDAQDVLINSQHPAKTYKNFPKAVKELATKGAWYTEYMENGGEQNTYFDGQTNTFKKEDTGIKKIIGMPLRAISAANNFVERAPRLAEYIASREDGRSVEVSMLDAARVTTNFRAGGDVTKFLNRNGATFLNASIQGAMQQVRNVREAKANGLKGWVHLATKFAAAGLPAMLLNNLLWEDDEEYEELSDYVKDNYYVVAKYGDGQFVRIPKGRTLAVIQEAFEQISNAATGNDEVDLKNFLELAISNLAPNNPVEDNIFAPIIQAANNETWYGEDLVPTRLQDLPNAEQYDESTDAISKWLGEKLDISPYKLNYLLNQYSGGIGDVFLPMITPEAERGDNSLLGNIIAPIKDKFTTDSTMNNQNVSDFYTKMDELTTNAKSSKATDEDVLKYKYFNSINSELGELYAQKREIQNSNMSNSEKYEAAREIQDQINALASETLNAYNDVDIEDGYATIGDLHYRTNKDGEWEKITDKQLEKQEEVTNSLGVSASEYWNNKEEYDFAYDSPGKYAISKSVGGYETYKKYSSELYDIKADKDASGKTIVGSRKEKVSDYINGLDLEYGAKIILFKNEYNADDTYNYDIIDYLNNHPGLSYEDVETILKELGFNVDSEGNVTWN